MPKLKTHRGAAKRFKRTKSGKFLRKQGVQAAHPEQQDQVKRKRELRGTTTVADVDAREARADAAA